MKHETQNTKNTKPGFLAPSLDLAVQLNLFVKGDSLWLDVTDKKSRKDVVIIRPDDSEAGTLSLQYLLKKKAKLYPVDFGACVKITKIGDGCEAKDFEIDFDPYGGTDKSTKIYFAITAKRKIDMEKYFDPMPWKYTFFSGAPSNMDKKQTYFEIMETIKIFLRDGQFKSVETLAFAYLEQIKQIGPSFLFSYYDDKEEIEGFLADHYEDLETSKNLRSCARTRFAIAFNETMISVFSEVVTMINFKEKEEEKAKQNRPLHELSTPELELKIQKAVDDDDLKLAGQLQHIVNQRNNVLKES